VLPVVELTSALTAFGHPLSYPSGEPPGREGEAEWGFAQDFGVSSVERGALALALLSRQFPSSPPSLPVVPVQLKRGGA